MTPESQDRYATATCFVCLDICDGCKYHHPVEAQAGEAVTKAWSQGEQHPPKLQTWDLKMWQPTLTSLSSDQLMLQEPDSNSCCLGHPLWVVPRCLQDGWDMPGRFVTSFVYNLLFERWLSLRSIQQFKHWFDIGLALKEKLIMLCCVLKMLIHYTPASTRPRSCKAWMRNKKLSGCSRRDFSSEAHLWASKLILVCLH